MSDLIDRQETIKEFCKQDCDCDPKDCYVGTCYEVEIIESVPSVQPRRGKWIYGEHESAMCDGYRCNKCGFFVPWDYQHKFIDFIKDYNYCPSCGADMRGEQDDSV